MGRPAVFFDRDGVLVRDAGRWEPVLSVLAGAADATRRFRERGFAVVVVTNQPAVGRGECTLAEVERCHENLAFTLAADGGGVDAFYVCPHHPDADLPEWRTACACRKPRPGMLLRAARELDLDLDRSVLVGDRPTDIEAGRRAGCRTVLVLSGEHAAPQIVSPDGPVTVTPDHTVADALAAADLLLGPA